MVFVVQSRGAKRGLIASMPASLFGKFTTNGKAQPAPGRILSEAESKAAQKKFLATPALAHPKDEAVRSEPYRRLVAALPCMNCQRRGPSQAAHLPPDGKSLKQDDRETFPLCADGPRRRGCHTKFDQYELFPREEAMKQGRKWAAKTRALIAAAGKWPKKLAKWKAKK